ncbi:MAG: hypothetical protein QOE35_2573 [Actinomycetota bacterium]|jgi:hypothetical protein
MLKKTLTFLALTGAAVTMAASPAFAGSGPFIQLNGKSLLVQGGVSVQGTIKCDKGEQFREIDVTLAQGSFVNSATGGVQCDGSKQFWEVYVPGTAFQPGPAKAAAVSPAPEGSNGRALHDQRTVELVYPTINCSASATFC